MGCCLSNAPISQTGQRQRSHRSARSLRRRASGTATVEEVAQHHADADAASRSHSSVVAPDEDDGAHLYSMPDNADPLGSHVTEEDHGRASPFEPPPSRPDVVSSHIETWLCEVPSNGLEPVPECSIDEERSIHSQSAHSFPPDNASFSGADAPAERIFMDDSFPVPNNSAPLHRPSMLRVREGLGVANKVTTPSHQSSTARDMYRTTPPSSVDAVTYDLPQLCVDHCALDADAAANTAPQSPGTGVLLYPGLGLARRSSKNTFYSSDVPADGHDVLLDYFDAIPVPPRPRRNSGTSTLRSAAEPATEEHVSLPGQLSSWHGGTNPYLDIKDGLKKSTL